MFKTCPPKYLIFNGEWNKFFHLQFLWSCKLVSMMQTNSKLQILCYSPFKKDNKCIWMSAQEVFTYSSITHEWHNAHVFPGTFLPSFCVHCSGPQPAVALSGRAVAAGRCLRWEQRCPGVWSPTERNIRVTSFVYEFMCYVIKK